jgi:hypothetical protein
MNECIVKDNLHLSYQSKNNKRTHLAKKLAVNLFSYVYIANLNYFMPNGVCEYYFK